MLCAMELDILRFISTRCFVAKRVGMECVFMVEFPVPPSFIPAAAEPPPYVASAVEPLVPRVRVTVGDFDWTRKSFPVTEILGT